MHHCMKALDLFSVPGGLSLGMKRAGTEPVACVEKSKDAVAPYDAHIPTAEHFYRIFGQFRSNAIAATFSRWSSTPKNFVVL